MDRSFKEATMGVAQSLLPEFDHEAANTRKVLERVPEAHASWKPHAKSYTLGDLALHLANIPTWTAVTLQQPELDIDPSAPGMTKRVWTSRDALLKAFDENVAAARAVLAVTSDADMMKPWTLKKGGQVVFTLPRAAVFRSFVLSHSIHHRGQLTVYLRIKDVPLPAIFGPSADEAS
jgi:uncharacterized damage-inducible protein DinB